jgi:hypothetical protein
MPDTHARPPANPKRSTAEASRKRSLVGLCLDIFGVKSVVALVVTLLSVISAVLTIDDKIGISDGVRFLCSVVANKLPICDQATKPAPVPAPVPVPPPVNGGFACRSDGGSSAVDVCHEIDGDHDKLLRCFHLSGDDKLLVEVSASPSNRFDIQDPRFDATIRLSVSRSDVRQSKDARTYPGNTNARVVAKLFIEDTLTRCP